VSKETYYSVKRDLLQLCLCEKESHSSAYKAYIELLTIPLLCQCSAACSQR